MRYLSPLALLTICSNALWCLSSIAEPPQVQRLLPKSTVVYLRVEPLENVMSHPLIKAVRDSDTFRSVWRSPNVMKMRGGLTLFEFAVGDKIENLLQKLTAEGICVAIDKDTQGSVVLACTESQEWIEDYLQRLIKMARADAQSKKQPDPIKEADYRGVHGYEFQKVLVANIGSILMVTNKNELAKDIIDRFVDSTDDNLESNTLFQTAFPVSGEKGDTNVDKCIARGFVDLNTIRDLGLAKDLLGAKKKDVAAEILLGGVLATLQKTSYAIGSLQLNDLGINLDLTVPHETSWTQDSHSFFVGPDSHGVAPAESQASGLIGGVRAYRNLSELWVRAGDLFDEKVNDQLAQTDSTLTTLFSGRDFGTDILGAIEPQIQIVAAEQEFTTGNVPAIQLPSFALIAKLKDAGMKKELKRTFQSFIGFLNVAGAMEGQPQLDLDSESLDGLQIYSGTYLKDGDRKYENGLPIQFNFSPTLAFDGDTVYIASTTMLVKKLVGNQTSATHSEAKQPENTVVTLNAESLRSVLNLNRHQLISQNMLEKGHSKTEAENEIEVLMSVLSLFKSARMSLQFDNFARLKMNLEFNTGR